MKIQSTRGVGTDALKCLIYGAPGVGKTTLARTCPEKCLIISFEAGLLSLADSQIDYIDMSVDDEGKQLSKEKRLEKLDAVYAAAQTKEFKAKYRWIFLDSLTEIGQNIIEKYQKVYPDAKDSFPLWKAVAADFRKIVKDFRDLAGINVVFTALAEIEKDELGKRFQTVSLPGKAAQNILGYFDEVYYFHLYEDEEGKKKRVLITQPSDKVTAKDRSGKLDLMQVPDLTIISNKIRGTTEVVK